MRFTHWKICRMVGIGDNPSPSWVVSESSRTRVIALLGRTDLDLPKPPLRCRSPSHLDPQMETRTSQEESKHLANGEAPCHGRGAVEDLARAKHLAKGADLAEGEDLTRAKHLANGAGPCRLRTSPDAKHLANGEDLADGEDLTRAKHLAKGEDLAVR